MDLSNYTNVASWNFVTPQPTRHILAWGGTVKAGGEAVIIRVKHASPFLLTSPKSLIFFKAGRQQLIS